MKSLVTKIVALLSSTVSSGNYYINDECLSEHYPQIISGLNSGDAGWNAAVLDPDVDGETNNYIYMGGYYNNGPLFGNWDYKNMRYLWLHGFDGEVNASAGEVVNVAVTSKNDMVAASVVDKETESATLFYVLEKSSGAPLFDTFRFWRVDAKPASAASDFTGYLRDNFNQMMHWIDANTLWVCNSIELTNANETRSYCFRLSFVRSSRSINFSKVFDVPSNYLITASLFVDRPDVTDPMIMVGGVSAPDSWGNGTKARNFINLYKTEVDRATYIGIDYIGTYSAACRFCNPSFLYFA
jgi:hypothetical protein